MPHTLPLAEPAVAALPETFYSRIRPEPLGAPY